ncbi:MAG TPA: hypothetical protein VFN49_06235 [Candidatus Aquilonibacter sp.]|nr:hypothetical protein [Candidatus Aquilonibacter sp.]
MADTGAVKEHVKAFHDSIESAREKREEEAKSSIRAALRHLKAAREAMTTHVKGEITNDAAMRQKTLDHMNAVAQEAEKALHESGAHMRTTIRAIIDATEEILTRDL